jgi:hypothetical protein
MPHVRAARDAVVTEVARAAAARFWLLLEDFVAVHPIVAAWALPPDHPFLFTTPEGSLAVRVPPAAVTP